MTAGITHEGTEAEELFMALTGAHPSRYRTRGDCVLEGHYVEVKKVGREGQLNQIRPVKYIPLVAWHEPTGRWYVIPPHVLVNYACRRPRGQHTENPFECVALPLRLFRSYEVPASNVAEATLFGIAIAACHRNVQAAMRAVSEQVRTMAHDHRVGVQTALDMDQVVDINGTLLLPW